jgi:hypothetical protein
MVTATFRIGGIGTPQGVRDQIPFAAIERGEVIVRSRLEPEAPINDHLVWLWSGLKLKRRFLKRLQGDGAIFRCVCSVSRGPIHIQPNGAEMLHLLGAELIIETPSDRPYGSSSVSQ